MERRKRLVGDRWKLSVVKNVVKGGEEEEEEEGEMRKRMKNCFLVKQGRMHGYHTRLRVGRGFPIRV